MEGRRWGEGRGGGLKNKKGRTKRSTTIKARLVTAEPHKISQVVFSVRLVFSKKTAEKTVPWD